MIESLQCGARIHSYASCNENTRCKSSGGQRMGKNLEMIPAWQLTKVRNKKKVIDEARNEGRTVHFASSMDICHLKNAELETKHQKYKGRVVLQGDIVKDDSNSYAVFTEQGSSASQMTTAKVMDVIAKTTRMRRTSRRRSFCSYPGCNGKCTIFIEDPKIRMSRYCGYVYQDTNGLNHGPVWKIQSFLLSEICTVIFPQDYLGKGNSRKFFWKIDGKKFHIENAYSLTEKKDYSWLCMWTILK